MHTLCLFTVKKAMVSELLFFSYPYIEHNYLKSFFFVHLKLSKKIYETDY